MSSPCILQCAVLPWDFGSALLSRTLSRALILWRLVGCCSSSCSSSFPCSCCCCCFWLLRLEGRGGRAQHKRHRQERRNAQRTTQVTTQVAPSENDIAACSSAEAATQTDNGDRALALLLQRLSDEEFEDLMKMHRQMGAPDHFELGFLRSQIEIQRMILNDLESNFARLVAKPRGSSE